MYLHYDHLYHSVVVVFLTVCLFSAVDPKRIVFYDETKDGPDQ